MRRRTTLILLAFLLAVVPLIAGPDFGPPQDYLELDGVIVGQLNSAAGGYASYDLVAERPGSDRVVRKHVGQLHYSPITINWVKNMADPFWSWVQDAFDHKASRKSGAIISADRSGRVFQRLEFTNARIAEIDFPALDNEPRRMVGMTLTLTPEATRRRPGNDARITIPSPAPFWEVQDFHLRIDGLDSALRDVTTEPLVFTVKYPENTAVPQMRSSQREATDLEISNLVLSQKTAQASSLWDWYDSFMTSGRNGDNDEKNGSLEVLAAADHRTVLFRIDLKHIGLLKLEPESVSPSEDPRVRAELYTEEALFSRPKPPVK